ncbi:MAG: phenylalanine--tRNA ligase subunit beta [Bacteroidota bacterium]
MRVLQRWLQDYLKFSIPPETLVEKLTMLGLEFEQWENLGKKFDGFVVGLVEECVKHPNADRLTVCRVNVGKETLQVVCGAPNVAEGQKVALGRVGATVPRNMHDPSGIPFVLTQAKIRGIESFGMICSAAELDLGTDADGILVLDGSAKAGTPLAKHFGMDDIAFDVEITPNRPDWLSHIGVAREIGILTGKRPVLPKVRVKEGKNPVQRFLRVRVEDKKNCLRFAARVIRGVKIGPSPKWLQDRLRNVGLRPRNTIVDITNYVMLECGHPLHAFDYALLQGGTIVVRQAAPGVEFTTLDGNVHRLPDDAVMVCDSTREVSIAGIMGGQNSEINEATVDVVLESAYWNPASIRRTSKTLGIMTDASQRFERGADPGAVRYALDRATALVAELAGGEVLRGVVDIYPKKLRPRVVGLRPGRVNDVLGTSLRPAEIVAALKPLDILPVRKGKGSIEFRIPTYRVDIDQEIDLIEEVARVHGYDEIEPKMHTAIDFSRPLERHHVADAVRAQFIGQGFREIITNPMQDEERTRVEGITPVRILNPLSKEMGVMRSSLIPGMLQVVAVNMNRGADDLRLFEIGHVFAEDPQAEGRLVGNYAEEERVGVLICGSRRPEHWSEPAAPVDLFDLKGALETALEALGLDKIRFISYPTSNGLTEHTLAVEIQGLHAGTLGKVAAGMLKRFGIEGDVFSGELRLALLKRQVQEPYRPLPRFPKVRRDVAFVVDAGTEAASVENEIRRAGGELLVSVRVFDVYEGKGLPEGKKSLAFALSLMSAVKTLEEREIDAAVADIIKHIGQKFGAVLRSA